MRKQITTTPIAATQLRREDLEGPGRKKTIVPKTSPKSGNAPTRTKKCWCPECGTEYSGTLGKVCADETCSKCDVALVGYYCAPTSKEASDMAAETTEFMLLKMDDLETIEAGEGVSQVIVKDGAQGPVFELEGAEDAEEVAKAITAAFEKQAEGEPEGEDLEKQDEPEGEVTEGSQEELVKVVGSLSEAVEVMGTKIEEMGGRPMARPELPALGQPAEPRLQKTAEDDTKGQLADEEQATLNKVVGKDDATLVEAMSKIRDWNEGGELEGDIAKTRLRNAVSDIAFKAIAPPSA